MGLSSPCFIMLFIISNWLPITVHSSNCNYKLSPLESSPSITSFFSSFLSFVLLDALAQGNRKFQDNMLFGAGYDRSSKKLSFQETAWKPAKTKKKDVAHRLAVLDGIEKTTLWLSWSIVYLELNKPFSNFLGFILSLNIKKEEKKSLVYGRLSECVCNLFGENKPT